MTAECWFLDVAAAEASLAAGVRPTAKPAAFTTIGDTAIVNATGILTARGDWLFGGTSYDGIRSAVTSALEDPAVRSILLTVQSPGGEASGCRTCWRSCGRRGRPSPSRPSPRWR